MPVLNIMTNFQGRTFIFDDNAEMKVLTHLEKLLWYNFALALAHSALLGA